MSSEPDIPTNHSGTDSPSPDAVALGYSRVSTVEQSRSGLGIAAQQSAIDGWAASRPDRTAVEHHSENGTSGMLAPDERPVLSVLLDRLADPADPAGTLVVSRLDRLGRSVIDVLALMDRAEREGWSVVMLDLNVDTTTPAGLMIATVMASMARMERDMTAERTRLALAERAAAGVRLGRPVSDQTRSAAQRAEQLTADGLTLRAVADALTAEGLPRATGDRQRPWNAMAVKRALHTLRLDRRAAAKAAHTATTGSDNTLSDCR
ncbi:recombinase family protein [Candidatus Poriferisodalis sp.]|uniref:recombinase family protein n=1 Tax=Candidatus Poriferisodalis sp. TaxID=3101277 RepID=UPI003B599D05